MAFCAKCGNIFPMPLVFFLVFFTPPIPYLYLTPVFKRYRGEEKKSAHIDCGFRNGRVNFFFSLRVLRRGGVREFHSQLPSSSSNRIKIVWSLLDLQHAVMFYRLSKFQHDSNHPRCQDRDVTCPCINFARNPARPVNNGKSKPPLKNNCLFVKVNGLVPLGRP